MNEPMKANASTLLPCPTQVGTSRDLLPPSVDLGRTASERGSFYLTNEIENHYHNHPMSVLGANPNAYALNSARPQVLADLPVNFRARVRHVREDGALGERLLEMGLTPGTPIRVIRRGFWGGPLQVELRGYMLTLRAAQAQEIDVECE